MTAKQLMRAALNRKAVIGCFSLGCGHRPTPAAFVIGMQFNYVMNRLHELKIYKATKKTKI